MALIAASETGHIALTVGLTALLVGFAVWLGVVISRKINPNRDVPISKG